MSPLAPLRACRARTALINASWTRRMHESCCFSKLVQSRPQRRIDTLQIIVISLLYTPKERSKRNGFYILFLKMVLSLRPNIFVRWC